ncbi:hypothetical protein VP01_1178g2 [Puccinia sorghi]|uniref:Uncharacterized protein n=1 Tax=Puccinia sorghi TaxID=27349 RepID=A0A0L6VR54_9BASI|nr:hypothetical protein VP01_1178g2 [Puccinia sorghi]
MTKPVGNRNVLSTTPLVRWCRQRLHRKRSSGEHVHYLTGAERRESGLMLSPPSSPPPQYELVMVLAEPLPKPIFPRISHLPPDWQHTLGPKNSVLRRSSQPDENLPRRDQISVY